MCVQLNNDGERAARLRLRLRPRRAQVKLDLPLLVSSTMRLLFSLSSVDCSHNVLNSHPIEFLMLPLQQPHLLPFQTPGWYFVLKHRLTAQTTKKISTYIQNK